MILLISYLRQRKQIFLRFRRVRRAKNLERFAYEDSIRHAYLATFYTKETALEALQKNGLLEEKYLTRNGVPTWMVKGEKVDYQNAQKLDTTFKLVDFLVGSGVITRLSSSF